MIPQNSTQNPLHFFVVVLLPAIAISLILRTTACRETFRQNENHEKTSQTGYGLPAAFDLAARKEKGYGVNYENKSTTGYGYGLPAVHDSAAQREKGYSVMPIGNGLVRKLRTEFEHEARSMSPEIVGGKDRRPSKPFISGDGFRSLCKYRCESGDTTEGCSFSPVEVRSGSCIYVATTDLRTFVTTTKYIHAFSKIAHMIPNKYVVITHNGDLSTPDGDNWHTLEGPEWSEQFLYLLHLPNITAWFASNCHWNASVPRPQKLHCIPIGIENRYNSKGQHPEAYLTWIERRGLVKATKRLLVDFEASTLKPHRGPALASLSEPWVTRQHLDWDSWSKAVQDHMFVACPIGHGYDTHRTWEVLIAGSIPIVESTKMDSMYDFLPVMIVKNWTIITEELLDQVYMKFLMRNDFLVEKLFFSYWKNIVVNGA